LEGVNDSAPRLLRTVAGDLVAQTHCGPIRGGGAPVLGGLLLWADRRNWLILIAGARGERQVAYVAQIDGRIATIGRGLLPASDQVVLRLERTGARVDALCSVDGERWFTVGHVAFSAPDSLQVGLYAIGSFARVFRPGAHRDGTAIRFSSFDLWAQPTS